MWAGRRLACGLRGIKLLQYLLYLQEERETGYFDADGHYVERKNEDEDATDAWLESTEGA